MNLYFPDVLSSQRLLVMTRYSEPVSKITLDACDFGEPTKIGPANTESFSMFLRSILKVPAGAALFAVGIYTVDAFCLDLLKLTYRSAWL